MNLTARLALQQLRKFPGRAAWSVAGIALSAAMLAAVNGFASSGMRALFPGRSIESVMRAGGGGLLLLAAVLGAIIAASAIVVISNAFRVSALERTRQFGILKSVGATKKQIAATVTYEGLFLSLAGIPLGLALGMGVNLAVLAVVNRWAEPIVQGSPDSPGAFFPFAFSPAGLALAAVGAAAIVLVSAWLPARRAAKVSAIDAVFQSADAKTGERKKAPRSRGGKLALLLFGVEGQLAARQLRRSRRSFRATTMSLTISIIILLASASFQTHLTRQVTMRFSYIDADVMIQMDFPSSQPAPSAAALRSVTERLEVFPGARVRSFAHADYYIETGEGRAVARLLALEPDRYAELAREAGVPIGSNILINLRREIDGFGASRYARPYGHLAGSALSVYRACARFGEAEGDPPETKIRREIAVGGYVTSVDNDLWFFSVSQMTIVVPELEARRHEWLVSTADPEGFVSHAFEISGELPHEASHSEFSVANVSAAMSGARLVVSLFSLFIYGFAAMLTLISLTNAISAIFANTRLRAREFAALESVGMTASGIRRMLALEGLLGSARSLCIGAPLGLAAAYAVFLSSQAGNVRFPFEFPWEMLAICAAGVFALTFITMRFSASRLHGRNIIETIRGGE